MHVRADAVGHAGGHPQRAVHVRLAVPPQPQPRGRPARRTDRPADQRRGRLPAQHQRHPARLVGQLPRPGRPADLEPHQLRHVLQRVPVERRGQRGEQPFHDRPVERLGQAVLRRGPPQHRRLGHGEVGQPVRSRHTGPVQLDRPPAAHEVRDQRVEQRLVRGNRAARQELRGPHGVRRGPRLGGARPRGVQQPDQLAHVAGVGHEVAQSRHGRPILPMHLGKHGGGRPRGRRVVAGTAVFARELVAALEVQVLRVALGDPGPPPFLLQDQEPRGGRGQHRSGRGDPVAQRVDVLEADRPGGEARVEHRAQHQRVEDQLHRARQRTARPVAQRRHRLAEPGPRLRDQQPPRQRRLGGSGARGAHPPEPNAPTPVPVPHSPGSRRRRSRTCSRHSCDR